MAISCFWSLHYDIIMWIPPAAASLGEVSWDCVTCTLVFTVTAKEILHVNKRAWKALACGRHAGCCVSWGMRMLWAWMYEGFWTHSVTGADSWQHRSGALTAGQFVTYRPARRGHMSSWVREIVWGACEMHRSDRERWINTWGARDFAPIMDCFCKRVSLCVYASNGDLIW